MKTLIRILLGFIILCFSAGTLRAVTIDVTLPSYDNNGPIDNAISNAWTSYIEPAANAELAKYDNQEKLAKGFANANTYGTNAASLEGYQDYNLFALMCGVMVSAQMPAFSNVNYNYLKKIRYKIEEKGDLYFGTGISTSIINAGLNAGFIYPGLYINLKYGYLNLNGKDINSDLEGFIYKTSIYGIGINQILFWPRTIVPGLLRWRGIGIGTGFYYSKTETSISILKSLMTTTISPYTNTLILDPSFNVKMESTTMTVPLYVTTSIKFFQIMNFNLGTGADFNYGSSQIKLKASGSITTDIDIATATLNTPGYVTIEGGTKKTKPTTVNPKITTGLGFNFGPVKIDIPVAIYYLESGFSIGLSAGVII